ncbi:hypothetical protein HanXRQr2_Chr07g0316811 [Helianthus annuus]|uniref:Secreted protein n=1 Tax=Helianthus annuus TaxID=4232 RepID=A0A9K3NI89_HELAN|nr:hypothetical protein HanXRQr2_Chr07g0316811 [Helianthus annuus]KAJ0551823.1 hypothetical protein HanHA300_Chr07g0261331 [Helianthus annuus]KAJ0564783.1 hypothetical protein HanHA89_Chr07g0278051 [Helianthus annuus]KAJ0730095.1 hypothetical protein HanLR1_Chr07g0260261 [Helianthus annuus]KAJ0906506.1 hypothetical protein HanPSC8_Chr07g0306181 [Helianthus annuus]
MPIRNSFVAFTLSFFLCYIRRVGVVSGRWSGCRHGGFPRRETPPVPISLSLSFSWDGWGDHFFLMGKKKVVRWRWGKGNHTP